jgi:uncharacterized protein
VVVEPEKVVLDTNVLLSAVLFGGKPAMLVDWVRSGRLRAVSSLYILREFQDVLVGPRFGIDARLAEELAVELAGMMEVVPVGRPRDSWAADPADDPIIETALQGGASLIVTGDKRLLETRVAGIGIVTVAEMVSRIGGAAAG